MIYLGGRIYSLLFSLGILLFVIIATPRWLYGVPLGWDSPGHYFAFVNHTPFSYTGTQFMGISYPNLYPPLPYILFRLLSHLLGPGVSFDVVRFLPSVGQVFTLWAMSYTILPSLLFFVGYLFDYGILSSNNTDLGIYAGYHGLFAQQYAIFVFMILFYLSHMQILHKVSERTRILVFSMVFTFTLLSHPFEIAFPVIFLIFEGYSSRAVFKSLFLALILSSFWIVPAFVSLHFFTVLNAQYSFLQLSIFFYYPPYLAVLVLYVASKLLAVLRNINMPHSVKSLDGIIVLILLVEILHSFGIVTIAHIYRLNVWLVFLMVLSASIVLDRIVRLLKGVAKIAYIAGVVLLSLMAMNQILFFMGSVRPSNHFLKYVTELREICDQIPRGSSLFVASSVVQTAPHVHYPWVFCAKESNAAIVANGLYAEASPGYVMYHMLAQSGNVGSLVWGFARVPHGCSGDYNFGNLMSFVGVENAVVERNDQLFLISSPLPEQRTSRVRPVRADLRSVAMRARSIEECPPPSQLDVFCYHDADMCMGLAGTYPMIGYTPMGSEINETSVLDNAYDPRLLSVSSTGYSIFCWPTAGGKTLCLCDSPPCKVDIDPTPVYVGIFFSIVGAILLAYKYFA